MPEPGYYWVRLDGDPFIARLHRAGNWTGQGGPLQADPIVLSERIPAPDHLNRADVPAGKLALVEAICPPHQLLTSLAMLQNWLSSDAVTVLHPGDVVRELERIIFALAAVYEHGSAPGIEQRCADVCSIFRQLRESIGRREKDALR